MSSRIRNLIFSKKTMIFHEFMLEKLAHFPTKNGEDVIFENFNPEDFYLLGKTIKNMDFKCEFTEQSAEKRLALGNYFYVAKKENEIVGFTWIMTECFTIPYFDGTIHLKNDEFYTINGYVHKSFRGQNIFGSLKAYAFDDLRKRGYKRAIGSYFSWNKASHRMNSKFGSVPIGRVTYGYLGTIMYRYSTVKTNKIIFNSGPFSFWKRVYNKIKKALP